MMGSTTSRGWRLRLAAAALLPMLALAGCGDSMPKLQDLNPFAEKELPLPGKRIAVMQQENLPADLSTADRPVSLPQPQPNDSWSQPGGVASNAPGHLAIGGSIKVAWNADAGTGTSFYGKLTASPIVYEGMVFTLDAAGKVSAFSVSSGSSVWRVSTTPPNEKDQEGFGGGLAADGGRLYVGTGFGYVMALEPRTGKKIWEKYVGSPVRLSPTAVNDRVFILSKEGQVYCLQASDGAELWTFRGLPERASILSNASPAVDGDISVIPYPTGDLIALRVATGQPAWSESLSRSRTASSMAAMSDTARPVIEGGTVFAIGHAGRMVATAAKSGERLWTLNVPSLQPPWVSGDAVFVVDTGGQLMAINRRDGKIQWTTKLTGATTWSGPVLAGYRLWLTSNKGQLASVDATTGKIVSTQDLGQPIFIAPVIAGGRMFVLTDKARLIGLN